MNEYEMGRLATYFQSASKVWKTKPALIKAMAQIAEFHAGEFRLKYDFPLNEKQSSAKENAKPKSAKTPREKLTIANIRQLENYFDRVVKRFEKSVVPEEYAFLDKLFEQLGFDETDRKLGEILLLSYNSHFEIFFGQIESVKNSPSSAEVAGAFLGREKKDIFTHMRSASPLASSGLIYQQSRDYDGDYITNAFIYHLHDKIGQIIDEGEFDVSEAIAKLIGKRVLPETEWDDFEHIKTEAEFTANILRNAIKKGTKGINILVYGETGTGKTEFCKALAAYLGVPLYAVGEKPEGMEEEDYENNRKPAASSPAARLADKRLVENLLGRRSIKGLTMFDEMEDILRAEQINLSKSRLSSSQMSKLATNSLLTENGTPCLWTANNLERFDPALLRRFSFAINLKTPDASVRQRVIARTLKRYSRELTADDTEDLARRHAVPPAFFSRAIESAALAADGNDQEFLPDLRLGLRSVARIVTGRMETPAPRLVEQYDLSLVNADQDIVKLTEKLIKGPRRNFSICGYGVSGAGKSEYLVYLAHKMEMDALLVPYSAVGSSFVSETEHNIRETFERAADEKKFLIFDEADSLLTDRRNAQHNWEKTAVNEMLTGMEKSVLPFGCTTNLMDGIDPASLRRFVFKIRFQGLTPEQSRRAYLIYFKHDLPKNVVLPEVIAPGDFANVLKQAQIVETLQDPQWLVRALLKECDTKGVSRPMGFRAPSGGTPPFGG